MNKDLVAIFEYLEREKGIKRDVIVEAIEESLRAAARKSVIGASNVTVKVHPKTGNIDVFCEKHIVKNVAVPAQEISLEQARLLDPDSELDQYIDVVVTPKDFGRIAAQKARQVITQKLRYAERDVIYEEYRHRKNQLISGTVKRYLGTSHTVVIDLGKVEALLPMRHYPRTEKYRVGDKVLALLLEVAETEEGSAEVILSRSHPDFVRLLMEREVPEIGDGTVVIERIVRDAGYRTKILVRSIDPKVDPVGACVGMRGKRVKSVGGELHNEKIDIIPYVSDPLELLQNALDLIEIRKVSVNEEEKVISIVVDDENFAAVIGKRGMNARLNGELIGYELEVQRLSDYNQMMMVQRVELANTDDPLLDEPLQIDSIEGVNALILNHLVEERFTPRAILTSTPEQFAQAAGISREMADKILEQIRKQRI